jgi:nucleoside-diphosphate-sugar epimerase
MASVLVTGGSGFIGWHSVRALLARGDDVTCLVRETSCLDRLRSLPVKLAYGDVTDYESLSEAVAGKSVVYHLAAIGTALRREDLFRINERGAENVARQCARQSSPPVLVVVSSLAAGGPTTAGRERTESDPSAPVSNYGCSKRAGELAVRRYADRVPTTIIRPSVVFGEADHYCLPLFRMVYRHGIHFAPSFSKRRFSFLHADDLVSLLLLAAERGERLNPAAAEDNGCDAAGLYYASSGEHPVYHEVGRIIGEAAGRARTRVISAGPLWVWSVAAALDIAGRLRGRPAVFSIDKAREARAGHWVCSARKAIEQLGYRVAKPLAERIRQTAHWYLQEGWL